ncbi:MAG: TldD/PmbA family protein [Methanobacteriota archaeon]|nr:MAG: TldD/PmbA family protein [Euryarchaeota archaeon]
MTKLSEFAEDIVGLVGKMGGTVCDVLVVDSRVASAEVEKSSIKQAEHVADPGVAIRVFHNGSSGFVYCTSHEIGDLQKAAELAVSQARAGTADEDFKGLPEPTRHVVIEDIYDSRLAALEPETAVDMLIALVNEASDDERITSVNAGLTASVEEVALANSNGIVDCQKITYFDVFAEAVARSGDSMFSGLDYASSRRMDVNSPVIVGGSAKQHAIDGLSHAKMQTGDYPVVLDPLAAGYILASALGGGVNAENIQRKRSYLVDKLGTEIGSEILSVYDDPTLQWGLGSTSFDGEGVAARKKTVVERGELKTYLFDSYTAGKDSVENTGNSSRGGGTWSYTDPPGISFSNMVVERGDASLEEMIEECGRGVYLRITFDSPNLATGEFSGLMMEGYTIENGETGPSIRQSTMGINLLDMFSRIDIAGSKSRNAFGVETPALRISHARIGGSE